MSYTLIQLRKNQHSGTIILRRPDKRNALSRRLLAEIQRGLNDFYHQKSVRAVILTGAGTTFCAGMDLSEMHQTNRHPDPLPQWHEDVVQLRELLQVLLRFPKPIIAAVNGPALGAGAGLVLASDIVLATPEAEFGFPEPLRGLAAGLAAPLLVFRVGAGQAAHLLLTARSVPAEEALRRGIYHDMVPQDLAWARAHELAGQCARGAPEALALTKRMLNETIGESLSTMLAAGAAVSATARTTEAAAEGIAAFVEKRDPEWP
jgi:enoyl-CoA hydratase/carnithine racemase